MRASGWSPMKRAKPGSLWDTPRRDCWTVAQYNGAVVIATPFVRGRHTSLLLADDVLCNALDGIEVLRQKFTVIDRDAERLLDESDDLQHSRRVDDALIE